MKWSKNRRETDRILGLYKERLMCRDKRKVQEHQIESSGIEDVVERYGINKRQTLTVGMESSPINFGRYLDNLVMWPEYYFAKPAASLFKDQADQAGHISRGSIE